MLYQFLLITAYFLVKNVIIITCGQAPHITAMMTAGLGPLGTMH